MSQSTFRIPNFEIKPLGDFEKNFMYEGIFPTTWG